MIGYAEINLRIVPNRITANGAHKRHDRARASACWVAGSTPLKGLATAFLHMFSS